MNHRVRRSKKFVVSAVILAAALSVFSQTQLNQILDRMDSHNRNLTSLQATVTMTKYNAQIRENDPTYSGRVWYTPGKDRKKSNIRIEWTSPVTETLVVSSGKYRLFRPKLKQGYEGNVDRARSNSAAAGPLSFLSMSRDQLRTNFTVKLIGPERVNAGRINTTRIELTPKERSQYKRADLWIDGSGMPVQARIVATNNDTTTLLITGEIKNKSIDSRNFNFKFPPGTKIIKD
jgi:outer membrane lipoprotein-sorting protein